MLDPRHERPWAVPAAEVATQLETDLARGLSAVEAAARLTRFGRNELLERGREPVWRLFVRQFTNAMILVLVVAAAITVVIGDYKDTVVILAIVVLNGVIGFVQEYRAEEAMAALRRLASPSATVIRDDVRQTIPASEVVPGDVVVLEAGGLVPADLRLVEARALRINEAALTGESVPAEKTVEPLPDLDPALIAERRNMAFSGTAVVYGRGVGVVVATGMATALGQIAELVSAHVAEATPLQRRLTALGKGLAAIAIVVCVAVFGLGIARGESPEVMFLTAVSLAVAAIPEGLPAVVTIALALGARRMARRRALVRRLPAVETLGSVDVICTDKTGTLTTNEMVVERVWTPAGTFVVGGSGYAPEGSLVPIPDGEAAALLDRLAAVGAACNDASLIPPSEPGGSWSMTGDPTEAALLALAGKRGIRQDELHRARPRIEEITFDPDRRRMTTFHRTDDGIWVAVKGALEAIAPELAPGQEAVLEAARQAEADFAADGYRVLALAERRLEALPDRIEDGERDLILLGLVALADPPRPAAIEAVAACRTAGIRPIMVTGDHPVTARAIAARIGLLGEGKASSDGVIMTGAELASLSDPAFAERVADVVVYARTSPEQKLRIVSAWQARGATVAMTGDGVNDAPALRAADIGVAMGLTGTEVAKESADMVLADDDFATIVAAVEEGRRIYDNIRRFVRYLLTTNSAEIWVMVLAPLLGLPVPLVAIQILWINLVTDGLPALALGVEPAEPDVMRRPPRPRGESILGRGLWQHALVIGLLMAGVTILVQAAAIAETWHWQSMVFTTLALLQLGHALAIRSERTSTFRLGWRTNLPLTGAVVGMLAIQLALLYVPALQPIFETEALGPGELAVVLVASTVAFVAVEIEKAFFRWRGRSGGSAGSTEKRTTRRNLVS